MSAWYRSGTIAVAGKTVTGTGTNWTDNKAGIGEGQALLIPGAGTVKVYEIARVDSATQLTLTDDAGTVVAGQAYAIMSFYANSVPDFSRRLAAQLSYYQSQMDGWQEIMTGTGNITLEAPDGTLVTLSSFTKLTNDMAAKADKVGGAVPVSQGGTGSTDAAGARTNLGLKGAATRDVGKVSGTVAAGDDSRLNTIDGKTGGTVSSPIFINQTSTSKFPAFQAGPGSAFVESSGVFRCIFGQAFVDADRFGIFDYIASNVAGRTYVRLIPFAAGNQFSIFQIDHTGEASARVFTPLSDARVKDNIEVIEDPEEKLSLLRGVTYRYKNGGHFGIGFIGQDVESAFPEAVSRSPFPTTLPDGTVVEDVISPDTYGVGVAVLTEMCKKLARQRDEAIRRADNQEAFLKTLGFDPEKDYTATDVVQVS